MKHRVREAIFNLLGTDVLGKHAIDLFAGTGAIGLEALSRGATSATFIERHVPTARLVRENIDRLGVGGQCTLLCTSAFLWAKRNFGEDGEACSKGANGRKSRAAALAAEGVTTEVAWVVFCSPPYDFYVERPAEMAELIGRLLAAAPHRSVLVVEADDSLDFDSLPTPASVRPTGAKPAPAEVVQPSGRRAAAGAWRVRSYPPARIGILRVPAGEEKPY